MHFIDNAGAQRCIVKGSSRVGAGDVIIGHTWETAAGLGAMLWVDRVSSKCNPVDALSRGRLDGPWDSVAAARLPRTLVAKLCAELFDLPGKVR